MNVRVHVHVIIRRTAFVIKMNPGAYRCPPTQLWVSRPHSYPPHKPSSRNGVYILPWLLKMRLKEKNSAHSRALVQAPPIPFPLSKALQQCPYLSSLLTQYRVHQRVHLQENDQKETDKQVSEPSLMILPMTRDVVQEITGTVVCACEVVWDWALTCAM